MERTNGFTLSVALARDDDAHSLALAWAMHCAVDDTSSSAHIPLRACSSGKWRQRRKEKEAARLVIDRPHDEIANGDNEENKRRDGGQSFWRQRTLATAMAKREIDFSVM